MKQQSIKFKSINVAFTDEGKGKAVVFLHGFLASKEMWKPFAKELSRTQRVITIDLLGHGNTDCLSYVHTMEEMAEAVEAVLRHLKLKRYYLVGHSLGGYVSLAMAENNPDNIKGLVMFHSSAKTDNKQKKIDRGRAIKIIKRNAKVFINEAIPNLFNTKYKPYKRGINQIKKLALNTPKQGIIAALEGMKNRVDREIILKFAPYPVLFIIGDEDNILSYQDLIDQAKLPDNGGYLLLEKVGHMGFIEAKKETYRAIKKFILSN
ncbi:MAG: alpha/beta hydrolase [Flavobacteriales bacterium]|nr:MAG: alpha/beta hydrolase [Flavobacteriales bacterium]